MENEEKNISEIKEEKMPPKEKRNAIIILSVIAVVALGTIVFPIIGTFASKISPSKKGSPSFSWDNQTPGTYGTSKTFRTNEGVFSISKDDDVLSLTSVNVTGDDAYLIMPSMVRDEDGKAAKISSIPNLETNILTSSSVSNLKGIYFPSLYLDIGNNAFSNLDTLSEIKFGSGDGNQKLGNYIFKGDSSLMEVTFSKNLKTLGIGAFENATSIKKIDFSETQLETLGQGTFKNCSSLEELVLPRSISSIPANMIDGCSSLSSITYLGNTKAWNSLAKDSSWNANANIQNVVCSDGTIAL